MSSAQPAAASAGSVAVMAHWNTEVRVWWAESADLPGVVAEAATMEALIADLRAIVPEILLFNGAAHPPGIEIRLTADRIEAIELTP